VQISAFEMDIHPVTNREFRRFAEESGHVTEMERVLSSGSNLSGLSWCTFASADREDHPVVMVNWFDACAFAKWYGKRLPTEAEWERAARGELESASYPWGDMEPDLESCCWRRASSQSASVSLTTPVCSFSPNSFGLYDMVGNVWEWCADWYSAGYYAESALEDPQGPSKGQYRVRRGGAWNVRESFRLRCANRGAMDPRQSWPNLGFRCAGSKCNTK
jgi:formylglycine-generating enzyme required for sulfatase activity